MAVDMFLMLTGIAGESQDSKHKGQIDIDSFSFGVSQSGSGSRAGGSGSGKADFQDIAISKLVDKATPTLVNHCATGEHIKEALITVRKAGGGKDGGKEYYKVKLTDVLVSSVQNSGNNAADFPSETITLNYARIDFEYLPQDSTGNVGGVVKSGYNLRENKAV